MTVRRAALTLLILASACAADGTDAPTPWAAFAGEPPELLSETGLFQGALAQQEPAPGVVPYSVNAPLWSDRALKFRFVALPPGTAMTASVDGTIELPVGAVIVKAFGFPADFDVPGSPVRLIETRLLVHDAIGWTAHVYLWNAAQTEATRFVPGKLVDVTYRWQGTTVTRPYVVPNTNQCKDCHSRDKRVGPIGLTTAQVRPADLEMWSAGGLLAGTIPAGPTLADPYDEAAAPLEERARAWLHTNCAHCHRPGGEGGPSGLVLEATAEAGDLGACKTPVAAGPGSGDAFYDIVPGRPDDSILVHRITSTDPGNKMPEIPNLLPDEAGVALIRDWITAMDGPPCAPKRDE